MYAAATPATGAGTTAGEGGGNARFRTNAARNAPKYARVKAAKDGGGGGTSDATVLVVRKLTRFDSGRYECRVRNSVGAANSSNFANVRVQCECQSVSYCFDTDETVGIQGVALVKP